MFEHCSHVVILIDISFYLLLISFWCHNRVIQSALSEENKVPTVLLTYTETLHLLCDENGPEQFSLEREF